MELAKSAISNLSSMLRGSGYDRRKHTWKGSMEERRTLEKLVELGIVDVGIQYPKDKGGMYYITDSKKPKIREWLKEALEEYEWWRKARKARSNNG